MFKTFTAGRSEQSDVVIDHETISRVHLEITRSNQGRFFVIDRQSSWGTYVWQDEKWEKIKQGYLLETDHIALGKKKVLLGDLVARAARVLAVAPQESVDYELITVRPRRSVQTGEVSEQ